MKSVPKRVLASASSEDRMSESDHAERRLRAGAGAGVRSIDALDEAHSSIEKYPDTNRIAMINNNTPDREREATIMRVAFRKKMESYVAILRKRSQVSVIPL